MGKTLEVARDRAHDKKNTVLPVEVARGIYIHNPPSAQALKVLHFMISSAGALMADEVRHEFRLSDLHGVQGMRKHDRASLEPLFIELRSAVLVHDDTEQMQVVIGGLLDQAVVDYREEACGDLVVMWWFARTFRDIAAQSNLWALIDRQTIFALSSKYSILLFQHIASLSRMDRKKSHVFTVEELRLAMGVGKGKLDRFNHLNTRAILPAIEEISQLSSLNLTSKVVKTGRSVSAVEISWELKEEREALAPAQKSLQLTPPVRFPTGSIFHTKWQDLFDKHHPRGVTLGGIAEQFRASCAMKDIPLDDPDIEGIFIRWLEAL